MNEENNQNMESDIDLVEIGMILLKKIGYILLVACMCAIVTFTYFKFIAKREYKSTTQIFVMDKESGDISSTDISLYTALSNDYIQLIKTRPVLEKVISQLGLDIKSEELSSKISATRETDSRIITISAVDTSPVTAKRIVDAIAVATSEQIYNVMEAELVNIVQPGNVPEQATSTSAMKKTLIAFVLGAFAVCAFIIIRYVMDDTIVKAEDIERYLGLSVIGTIPVYNEDGISRRHGR